MIIDEEIVNMKFSKKIGYFAVVFLSFTIIGCSNPGNTPVIPIQTGTNGANPTTPANPESPTTPTTPAQPESPATPTNPETPATTQPENPTTPTTPNSPTTPTNPEAPEPQYTWIMTRMEIESKTDSSEYNYSADYTYSYYNSEFDCKNTSISASETKVTLNGTLTNSSTNTKSVSTFSQTGNNIINEEKRYTKDGSTWGLSVELRRVYYKNYSLLSSSYSKTYPAGTETLTNKTIEQLDNSNGIERYKVTDPSITTYYFVYEFVNNKIQKIIQYYTDSNKKISETDYIYSNNSILQSNNIELALTQSKNFDSNEQLTIQINQTLENVTLNANNTITVRLGSSANTSTNYSYTTETFTRIQVPLTQQ